MSAFQVKPSDFEKLFPFSFSTDESGKILQAGPSMLKIHPQLLQNNFIDVFEFVRPQVSAFDSKIQKLRGEMIKIRDSHKKCDFMGQIIHSPDQKQYLFVVSLFIQTTEGLKDLRLSFDDFAVQDQVFDFLMLLQTHRRAIAEADRLNRKLSEANKITVKALEMKTQFLANMSHELRTPMNGVLGMASVLSQTPLSAEQKEYVDCIVNSGENMIHLVNDILDLSKIDSGELVLQTQEFNLKDLITNVYSQASVSAESKNLGLELIIHSKVPSFIRSDPDRLRQVLSNLVSNAIKFTDQGSITTEVTIGADAAHHSLIRFTVKDTGIGIASEAKERIFQPFEQGDSSMSKRYAGIGMGLSISQKLVQALGGNIGVESEIGEGSKFWFTIKPAN